MQLLDLSGDLQSAYDGSYYTILGAGGDKSQWLDGYGKLMKNAGIGEPSAWYVTTGEAVNEYGQPDSEEKRFQPELTILMFPLDGLDVSKLAIFRLQMGDVWFDDVIDDMTEMVEDDE